MEEIFVVDPGGDPTGEGAPKRYITTNPEENVEHANNQVICSGIAPSVIVKLAEDRVTMHGVLHAQIIVD